MRKPNFNIDPIFTERWSPRAFTNEAIPDAVLKAGFEAARWAPSSANGQPWRFIYSKRDSSSWNLFQSFMVEGNRAWANQASALVVILSKKDFEWGGKLVNSASHSFDTGAAWMSLALQLTKLGWSTHGMGGIEHDKIRTDLKIPENYQIEAMLAIGKRGDKSKLPPGLQEREMANDRNPLESVISEGVFKP